MEEKISSKGSVEIMGDGLRYRRKRKHNEINNFNPQENENLLKKDGPYLGKKFKYFKNKENKEDNDNIDLTKNKRPDLNHQLSNNINKIKTVIQENNIIANTNVSFNNQINSKISKKAIPVPTIKTYEENTNYNSNSNSIPIHNNTNNFINKNITKPDDDINFKLLNSNLNEGETKKIYIKEYDRIKTSVRKYQESFENESFPLMVGKLVACCKKNSRSIKDLKVATLFKEDFSIKLKTTYSNKTILINLELFIIDLLVESKNTFQGLLEVDYPNIGNILLCYYSETCILNIINSILPTIEANIEKHSDVIVIKLGDVENLLNHNKLICINQVYKMHKENYLKLAKSEKNIKRGKAISSEFDNIVYSELINTYTQQIDIKNIRSYDFDNLQEILLNNSRYVDVQLKKSDIYHRIIKYAHEEAIQNNQKKINMMKIKKDLTTNHNDLFNKICNLDIFYANTADLILDFLEN